MIMADESNGESSFEFVEKKSEDFAETARPSISTMAATVSAMTGPVPTAPASNTDNLLINVAPPSELPSFVIKSSTTSPTSIGQNTGAIQTMLNDNVVVKPPSQLPKNISESESKDIPSPNSLDKGPKVLIAPDSPTLDSGVLASSIFSWVKDTVANSTVVSKVAEKAKNLITTLDPQMREFIYSGGDIEVVVASDKDVKVAPIREAFQNVFGNATVTGTVAPSSPEAIQPIGFEAGIKAAQERIAVIRKNSEITADLPVVAVENFLIEIGQGKWYDIGVLILEDVKQNINLQTFTQMTPVPSKIVEMAKESTPENYSKNGLAVTIGSLMGANLQVSHTEWHSALTGVSRKDIIYLAAQSLAGIYKNTINPI